MKTVTVDGKQVGVGDWVCFKCDIEQSGRIAKIKPARYGAELLLENESGFSGEYIGRDTSTIVSARDCWLEG
jgi:hypothetical protein